MSEEIILKYCGAVVQNFGLVHSKILLKYREFIVVNVSIYDRLGKYIDTLSIYV